MYIFIHIANVIYLCSYLVKDVLWLRVLSVIAGIVLLGYYARLPMPLWPVITWNILFAVINTWQISLLLRERRPVKFRPDERLLYELAFRRLTQREFAKLLAIGQWRDVAPGERITRRGEELDQLTVLVSGRVRVESDGRPVAELRPGCLVGEMGFFTSRTSNADVIAVEPTRTVSWRDDMLRKLLATNVELRAALQQVVGEDLAVKMNMA